MHSLRAGLVTLQLRYSGNITCLIANASSRDDKCMCCPSVWLKEHISVFCFLCLLVIFGRKKEKEKKKKRNPKTQILLQIFRVLENN